MRRISTTAEVWAVIHASHRGSLAPFSSFSDPEGETNGGRGRMETTYGFKDREIPILHCCTTWDIDPEKSYERVNEKHEYWLVFEDKCDD